MTESEGGLATNVKVPLLQYIPMAWTPYFMAVQSPEAARRTLRQLTEGHMTDQQREHTVRLETWMRAACVRSGPIGANRYRSKLHMTWVALSRVGLEHGSLGNSQVGAVCNGTSGGAAAGGSSHRPADRNRWCNASSHDGGRRGGWRPPYEARITKVFSPLEHECIRLACGLDPANYDAG